MSVAAPVLLLAYACIAGIGGPWLIGRWRSLEGSPVASILVWQALSLSVLVSVVLAGIAVAVPAIPLTTDVALVLSACAEVLRDHYDTPGGALTSVAGALLAGTVLVRSAWTVFRELWSSNRQRSRQRLAVRLVSNRGECGYHVVESDQAAAYCVPGKQRTVVLTTAALAHLDRPQLSAVLAHEDVHLHFRHHLVLAVAKGMQRAFPFVALYREAVTELPRLVEVHADDVAAKRHDRRALALALVSLAEARLPSGALGAGGTATMGRVTRLVHPPCPMGRTRSLALTCSVAAMMALPFALAALPALGAIAVHYCPVDWTA